jgi:hypothetical protein
VCVYEFISGGGYLFQQQVQSEELSLIFTAELKNVMSVGGQGLFFVFRSAQTGVKTHSLVFGICWRLSLAGDKQIRAIDLLENGSIQIEFHLLNKTDAGAKTFHFIFSCPGNQRRVSLMIRKAGSANNRQRHTVRALSLCVCTRVEFCSFSFLAIERSVVAREVEKHAAAAHAAFYIGGSPCDRNPYRSPARSHSRK